MRKILIGVAAVIVVLVALMLLLPHLIDVNQYHDQIQAQLQNRLNRPVKLGAMSLAVFPLRVQVQNVTIGEDPRFHSNLPFADVGEMDLSVKLFPLPWPGASGSGKRRTCSDAGKTVSPGASSSGERKRLVRAR